MTELLPSSFKSKTFLFLLSFCSQENVSKFTGDIHKRSTVLRFVRLIISQLDVFYSFKMGTRGEGYNRGLEAVYFGQAF